MIEVVNQWTGTQTSTYYKKHLKYFFKPVNTVPFRMFFRLILKSLSKLNVKLQGVFPFEFRCWCLLLTSSHLYTSQSHSNKSDFVIRRFDRWTKHTQKFTSRKFVNAPRNEADAVTSRIEGFAITSCDKNMPEWKRRLKPSHLFLYNFKGNIWIFSGS